MPPVRGRGRRITKCCLDIFQRDFVFLDHSVDDQSSGQLANHQLNGNTCALEDWFDYITARVDNDAAKFGNEDQVIAAYANKVIEGTVPVLKDVLINRTSDGRYIVAPYWNGVDRPDSSQWSCGTNEALAKRLRAAILAGVIIEEPVIAVDNNGKSYVSNGFAIRMRSANAELKRLGY